MFKRPTLIRAAAMLFGFVAALSVAHAQTPAAGNFVEGKQYFLIEPAQPGTVDGKIEVVEIFSYGCPACNAFQATMKKIHDTLPANAVLTYLPASFNTAENWPLFQRAYFTAQALGIIDKVHDATFDAIWKDDGSLRITDPVTHQLVKPMPTIEDVAKFYARFGAKPEDVVATSSSFAVNAKMKRADSLLRAYGVDSTPTIVVGGKYRFTGRSVGSLEQVVPLVQYLIAKEAGAKPAN
ncbi:thiol:disulfide interchange protein DsbA/DsbL [Dokdonella sp.]|uniref:thiol:disulfide interchange protein DsbA/DsbL n=1 Tax=Dokdonella sp. TaxID=2291710 RepID=UPI0025BED412|nr:thiol:disulfide interchange protein DsbA/DsbL [Dokdonella sp.]